MSNLYLYTFLATLLLLLAISVLIVGRSIFIRRRARRLHEEAIRNGTLPLAGRNTVKFGAKPKLFNVFTTRNETPGRSPPDDTPPTWANIMPLSASCKKPASLPLQAPAPPSPAPIEPPSSLLFRLVPQLRPRSRVVTPPPSAHPLETRPPPRKSTLTVSVIVAMPTPPTANHNAASHGSFPSVQIGVTRIPISPGWTADTKSQPS